MFIPITQLVLSLLLLIGLFYLIRLLVRGLIKVFTDAKLSSNSLLISLGVSVLFFSGTLNTTLQSLGKFLLVPLGTVEKAKTTEPATEATTEAAAKAAREAAREATTEYLNDWKELFYTSFQDNILSLPFSSILLAIAVWVLFALFIESMRSDGTPDSSSFSLKSNLAKNTLIYALLGLGLYLSIAAIVAIPEFQELDKAPVSINESYQAFEQELDDQIVVPKEDLLVNFQQEALKGQDSSSANRLQSLQPHLNELTRLVQRHNSQMENSYNNLESNKRNVLNYFRMAVQGKITNRELVKYELELKNWFSGFTRFFVPAATTKSMLEEEILNVKNLSAMRRGATPDSTYQAALDDQEQKLEIIGNVMNTLIATYYAAIQEDPTKFETPAKPKIGEDYGVFNRMTGWLLGTESMSLALIVGLFGFGLLGALASTFVREKMGIKQEKMDKSIGKPLIENLPAVLINGISAAIVVFLGVKGALLVFTTNADDLNPYMLFFTCIVAAVFSEDAWSRARARFNEQNQSK